MGWAGLVARVGKMENAFKILVGSPERKIPRESPRRMWKANIKQNLKK